MSFLTGASGLQEGRIGYNDPEFETLVRNNNPNIVFRNDRTGEDRIMSKVGDLIDAQLGK